MAKWDSPETDDLYVPADKIVVVDRDWPTHVDSITSLVAHRGLDDESKADLEAISNRARRLTTIPQGEVRING